MSIIRENPLTDEVKNLVAQELNALATERNATLEFCMKNGARIESCTEHKDPRINSFLKEIFKAEAPTHAPAFTQQRPQGFVRS